MMLRNYLLCLISLAFVIHSKPMHAELCLNQGQNQFQDWVIDLTRIVEAVQCPRCPEIRSACDLKSLNPIPRVILVGERHGDSHSEALNRLIYEMASSGAFPLLSEPGLRGAHLPWGYSNGDHLVLKSPQAEIEGIESPIPYSIILSYELQRQIIIDSSKHKRNDILNEIKTNIRVLPLFLEAYTRLKEKEKLCKECVEWIDRPSVERNELIDPGSIQKFMESLHKKLIDIAVEKYSDRLKSSDLPYFLSAADTERVQSQIETLMIDIRERDFTEKIVNGLCRWSKKSTAIVVLLGQGHRQGLQSFLEGLSGGRARIDFYQSSDPQQGLALTRLLQAIQFKATK